MKPPATAEAPAPVRNQADANASVPAISADPP